MPRYEHGVRVSESPTNIPTPISFDAGVPVIFGTSPVNLASDPSNATNKLFLCNTFDEAKAAVGYSEDYDYTLNQAIDAFFKAFAIGPVVLCNVLDPATNKETFTEAEVEIKDGQAVAATAGILLDSLVVNNGETALTKNEDYTVAFDDEGKLVVTMINTTPVKINLSGNKLKPSTVTNAQVIGAYDSTTGVETGLELVREVFPKFNLTPSLIVAPGFSKNAAVGAAMINKCTEISGLFTCECVIDLDTTTATKYTDVENAKKSAGYTSEHAILLWPCIKYNDKVMFYSAMYAAMVSYNDYANDNIPGLYSSNIDCKAQAAVLENGTEVVLDIRQADDYINAFGVVTVFNMNGFKAWGNNTAAYPDVTDPKDRWISCRRFFSWWGNTFIVTYFEKVDNPANYRLVESIVDSENVRGNSLVSMNKCAGLRMEFNIDDNPVEQILNGKIVFKEYLAPYTPAEDILNVLEFDPTMIEAALGGGE